MRVSLAVCGCACLAIAVQSVAFADIFRWDNGRIIPGTQGVTPQPGVVLDFRQLAFADLAERSLHGSSFRHANLSRADLSESLLTGSDLTLANLNQARLVDVDLGFSVLNLADLGGANLSGASITGSSLVRTKLAGANLTGATLSGSNLTSADFAGATVTGAAFLENVGFTPAQLYATASFQEKNLAGIQLENSTNLLLAGQNLESARFVGDLERVDFTGANLANATFSAEATWREVNITAADLRGADGVKVSGRNAILSMGQVEGLSLGADDVFVVRDYDGDPGRTFGPLPITVREAMSFEQGGRLRLEFDKDAWDSVISFAPGIPVSLGGTLELDFVSGINTTPLRGRPIRIFDWSGVEPRGSFAIDSPHLWDLTGLYTTGEIRLTGAGLPGDYNGNHVVDQVDLDLVLQNWGTESLTPPVRWVNDYPSGPIDQHELDKVLGNWGRTDFRTSGVPEPAALELMCCAVAGLAAMRVRRRTGVRIIPRRRLVAEE